MSAPPTQNAPDGPAGPDGQGGRPRACIFLMQLGGPADLGAITPFLKNLFEDVLPLPPLLAGPLAGLIARRRTPEVTPLYRELGGGSPLLPNTRAQGEALATRLGELGLPCLWQMCMRYAPPRASQAVAWARQHAADLPWIALSLYPHYSFATSRSSLRELSAQMTPHEQAKLRGICAYPTEPAYLDALAAGLTETLAQLPPATREHVHILFSAHGLPMKLVREGDPYPEHIAQTVQGILARMQPRPRHWTVSYQSRVGPVKWLEPATDKTLAALGAQGCKAVCVVPVAFVSEHIETLHELDIQLREAAADAGVTTYVRVPTVGCQPAFIDALAQTVARAIDAERGCCGNYALCERRPPPPT